MSDTQQPTEEELRAYVAQLREADPAEVLAQAYTMIGSAAEVKLGRPDSRVLIDAMGGLVEAAAASIDTSLADQMRAGVRQLQMAQVEAERQFAAQQGAAPEAGQAPPAGAPAGAPAGQPGPAQQPQQQMTDRLWIPGRDPGPPPSR